MKLALVLTACLLSSGVFTKEIGKATDPKALALSIQTCSGLGNCQQEQAGIAIDYGYVCNDPRNCYTVSEFIHFDNQDQKMLNVILIYFNRFLMLVITLVGALPSTETLST